MRFSALLITLGLTGALATPTLVSRQAPAVGVISDISAQTSALASAVSSYSGGDPSAVKSASEKLVSTINSGVDTVKSGPALSTADALALTSPVQDLTKQVEGVVSDLISKKDQFVAANAGGTVYQDLQAQYTAADNLAKAISAKVPESLADIAAQLSAGITAAIQKGLDAYKDAASSTGTASSSSAPATETATATETSTATGTVTETATSTPVIPTGTASGSASATPSTSATPTKGGSGSGSSTGSATASTSTNLLATGAASKEHFSYSLGGAVVAAAIAVAF
ncbi:cell wall mannoprotein 1 family protein [Aspergillus fischeri NRRL 181]|uniref:Cell wall mannoprotein 1 n=1 Tax=Neosartorya fischeri (strain ATCC 1020 / DSM 3700 / CBS 544.65 / FGSC A1164 / JCM 1740 / NRRL 181 / WB 181) TaxID=331117 RepID=A1D9V8_NEOFI|nr:cell wall serine-threonine-rich galactomannoprotein Mp1 [Aspergillus fischeri NRRL 181]EAW20589.1 cell wall serine-threonine-rich galactomannoprotein Mp1 [Aspergillus fischeri NRRL 181]